MFARCAAIWGGDNTISDAVRRQALIGEWLETFGHHEPENINRAISRLKSKINWWPKIAEVVAELRDFVDRPSHLPVFRAEPEEPMTAEESARRAEALALFKVKVGYKPDHGTSWLETPETERTVKPPSQSAELSQDALQSCASRRARGEPTCEPDCCRNRSSSNCLLRDARNVE